jgi:hypothetical protein
MLAPWAQQEVATADLNDARLNKRLTRLLSDLGSRPTASIPAACGGYKETAAAYRFFENDNVAPEKILQPHFEQTRLRMAEQKVVLLTQDTTEIDVTRPQQPVKDAGPLDTDARRGGFMHPLHAFTPDGTPLGAVWCQFWTRDEESLSKSAEQKRRERGAAPIEDKESLRWLEGLRQARASAQTLPDVQCVCIADSEADIYEMFTEPRGEHAVHWLIRACQDRALETAAEASHQRLRQRALEAPVQFSQEITVRGRQAKTSCETRERRQTRATRKAVVEVRATSVTLRPPARPDRALPPLLACAAVYLIVAWRTLFVCRLGRSVPDLDCEALFEPSEGKSVWMAVHREAPPKTPPKLSVLLALIAQLGGSINRKRKDPPGRKPSG